MKYQHESKRITRDRTDNVLNGRRYLAALCRFFEGIQLSVTSYDTIQYEMLF